jgi:branched-chain amino acid transport system substrate-binding protein
MTLTRRALFIGLLAAIIASDSIIFFSEVDTKDFYSNWIITINASIAAGLAIFLVYRQKLHGFHGKTHAALAMGLFLWLSADIVWAIYQLVLDVVPPIPSLADYLWLSAYGFLGYYLFGTYKEFQKRFNFGRKVLLASIIGNALFLSYIIALTLSFSVLSNPRGIGMFVVMVAYPILDATLMVPAIVILVEFRKEPIWFIPWVCESLGIFLIAISDSWFALIVLTSLVEQLWLSALFFAAHFLVMAAGLLWYIRFLLPSSSSHPQEPKKSLTAATVNTTPKRDESISSSSNHGSSKNSSYNNQGTTRRRRTLRYAIVFFAVAGLVGVGLLLYPSSPLKILSAGANSEVILPPSGGTRDIIIGALIPLTGASSSLGQSEGAALEIAVNDVNRYFANIHSSTRVGLVIEDTQTNPTTSLEKLKDLANRGVRIVVGPATSADIQQVKSYADQNGILVVSPSSTAPSFTTPDDNIFRLVPDDNNQAQAVSLKMWQDGVRAIVPIWRADIYGNGLVAAVHKDFANLGGKVLAGIGYEPRTGDFSTSLNRINFIVWQRDLASISDTITQAISRYGASKVGVYLVSFDEVVPIFIQAQSDPTLFKVKWYGSDGSALNDKIVRNVEAADFAEKTDFVSPIYGVGNHSAAYKSIDDQIRQKIGRAPRSYAEVSYDAFWLASLTENNVQEHSSIDVLKKTFVQLAKSHIGITGNTSLNKAGDRNYGDYDFWAVLAQGGHGNQGSNFEWKLVGRVQSDQSKVVRTSYETRNVINNSIVLFSKK